MSKIKRPFKQYVEIIDSNFARRNREWGEAAPVIAKNRDFLNKFLVDIIDCANYSMPGRNLVIMRTLNQSVDHAGCELSCAMGIHARIAREQLTVTAKEALFDKIKSHVAAADKSMKKAHKAWGANLKRLSWVRPRAAKLDFNHLSKI